MKVRLLGTAAGGGAPQWNCACRQCARSRATRHQRTQDCVLISVGEKGAYLLNASPDLRVQLLAAPELTPGPGPRETPLRGVLLTSAELDHTLGLLTLREASALRVYAAAPVLDALDTAFPVRSIMSPYAPGVTWHALPPAEPVVVDERLRVTTVPLAAKRPRYVAHWPAAPDWVVAHRVEDLETGGVLVYAPSLASWDEAFDAALEGVDCLIVDGTFFAPDEMASVAGASKGQRGMGHVPIRYALPWLTKHPGLRCLFTHLNNTNPVLDTTSPEHAAVLSAGAAVAFDGQILTL